MLSLLFSLAKRILRPMSSRFLPCKHTEIRMNMQSFIPGMSIPVNHCSSIMTLRIIVMMEIMVMKMMMVVFFPPTHIVQQGDPRSEGSIKLIQPLNVCKNATAVVNRDTQRGHVGPLFD